MDNQQIESLINAVRSIAHGGREPTGLEMLSMAVRGESTADDVCSAIRSVAEAINNLAEAVRDQ